MKIGFKLFTVVQRLDEGYYWQIAVDGSRVRQMGKKKKKKRSVASCGRKVRCFFERLICSAGSGDI